jgi:hypothetical protein
MAVAGRCPPRRVDRMSGKALRRDVLRLIHQCLNLAAVVCEGGTP